MRDRGPRTAAARACGPRAGQRRQAGRLRGARRRPEGFARLHRTRYDEGMMRVLCGMIAVGITVSGCDKKDAPAASGALSAAETELLQRLPAGNQIVFGGSYAKLQDFMQRTALGRMSRDAAEEVGGKTMVAWMQCISNIQ